MKTKTSISAPISVPRDRCAKKQKTMSVSLSGLFEMISQYASMKHVLRATGTHLGPVLRDDGARLYFEAKCDPSDGSDVSEPGRALSDRIETLRAKACESQKTSESNETGNAIAGISESNGLQKSAGATEDQVALYLCKCPSVIEINGKTIRFGIGGDGKKSRPNNRVEEPLYWPSGVEVHGVTSDRTRIRDPESDALHGILGGEKIAVHVETESFAQIIDLRDLNPQSSFSFGDAKRSETV